MSDALADLLWQAIQEAPGCNCRFDGYDIIEEHMACVAAALRANRRAVLEGLGYPEQGKKDCPDPWVCCLHPLTEDERARA